MLGAVFKLYGRNLLHHFGALVAALTPYLVQLITARLGWRDAAALSTAALIAWLLANSHVTAAKAGNPANAGGAPDLMATVEQLAGQFFGGSHTAASPTGNLPIPPGLEHLFGGPAAPASPAAPAGQAVISGTVVTSPAAGGVQTPTPGQ